MSGFEDETLKKWEANKTTSPVAVTDKKSVESISSQRSSSLVRSRKRRTTQDGVDDIGFFQLAAENRGKTIPRPLIERETNKLATTDNKDRCDDEHKNDFRDKTTSPFDTRAPTNPFCRENTIIVQYGELEDGKAKTPADPNKADGLSGGLPSTEGVASPKSNRAKGPKRRSTNPAVAKKSSHTTSAPPASPTNAEEPLPAAPQAHAQPPPPPPPPPAPPHVHDSGPSGPLPHSGQSHHPGTSPGTDPGKGLCDFPECPAARGPKQKERLCMGAECPVTMKKAVVKEAKRAMKRPCGKKRKNPLSILGAVLMSAFTGKESSCKLTKKEKKALKRMQVEEEGDDGCGTSGKRNKQSVGIQCKAPRTEKGPSKADKSTACDTPECPIAKQKSKIKEFMDKEQLCEIPSCPVKEPPPRKEKKVEPPKGCPAKPCTLKTKDEDFLKSLGPDIYETIPLLKMTCDQALADGNRKQSQPRQPAMKNKDRPSADVTKDKDRGVKIVAAHVRVPQPSENPFQPRVTTPREALASTGPADRQLNKNPVSSDKESECQKLGSRRRSAPDFVSYKADESERAKLRAPDLRQKERVAIGSEDGTPSGPEERFRNISVDQKDSLRAKGAPGTNEPIESWPAYYSTNESLKIISGESMGIKIRPNDTDPAISRLKTLPDGERGSKTAQSSLLSASAEDPIVINAASENTSKDQTAKKNLAPVTGTGKSRSKEIEIHPPENSRHMAICDHVEDTTSSSENPAMRSFGSFKFTIGEKIAERSEFGKVYDDKRFEKMLKIFVAEAAIATNRPKKSSTPGSRDPRSSETMSEGENVARILHELNETQCSFDEAETSRKIQFEKPVSRPRVCQDTEDDGKLKKILILEKNTSESVEEEERTGNSTSTARSNQLDSSEANETCTQTLATSAIKPNELYTIGVGSTSVLVLESQHLLPR